MSAYHHPAATRAIAPLNPLSAIRSAKGEWKHSAMASTCVGLAGTATRDAKREVDSMAEADRT